MVLTEIQSNTVIRDIFPTDSQTVMHIGGNVTATADGSWGIHVSNIANSENGRTSKTSITVDGDVSAYKGIAIEAGKGETYIEARNVSGTKTGTSLGVTDTDTVLTEVIRETLSVSGDDDSIPIEIWGSGSDNTNIYVWQITPVDGVVAKRDNEQDEVFEKNNIHYFIRSIQSVEGGSFVITNENGGALERFSDLLTKNVGNDPETPEAEDIANEG